MLDPLLVIIFCLVWAICGLYLVPFLQEKLYLVALSDFCLILCLGPAIWAMYAFKVVTQLLRRGWYFCKHFKCRKPDDCLKCGQPLDFTTDDFVKCPCCGAEHETAIMPHLVIRLVEKD